MHIAIAVAAHIGSGSLLLAADGGNAGSSIFDQFVRAGGWITCFVLIPLSVITVSLMIHYLLTIRRGTQVPAALALALVNAARQGQRRVVVETSRESENMLGQAAYAGMLHIGDGLEASMTGIDESVEDSAGRLMRRVEYLSVIGNVSPMIGLLGTVVGMIQAFNRIYAAGGQVPETSKLVGDIAIALVNTFWGLAIAIPALTAYAFFRNRIDAFASDCIRLCSGLVTMLSDSERQNAAAEADRLRAGASATTV